MYHHSKDMLEDMSGQKKEGKVILNELDAEKQGNWNSPPPKKNKLQGETKNVWISKSAEW